MLHFASTQNFFSSRSLLIKKWKNNQFPACLAQPVTVRQNILQKGCPIMNSNPKAIQSLEQQIAAGRKKLYEIYAAHGYTDPAVLDCSVRLDKLIVRYQTLTMISRTGPRFTG